ncbi:MAG: hypothetical protein AAGE94_11465 [Acidobacteriota bacterium]
MSSTTAPLSGVFALLLDRLRASKAGHFVAPRPAELAPRQRQEDPPAADHRQLYHTLPTRWGVDEGGYVPSCPTPSPSDTPVIRSRDEHRRNEAPASSRIGGSGGFRLFD